MHATFNRQTGRGIHIAVIDSGVNAAHPHVGGVSGGVGIDPRGREHDDYVDRLGHGTAVTAAIRERAPAAELFAVKVFDRSLSAPIEALVAAIDWAVTHQMRLINLSLGTTKAEHEEPLSAAVNRASASGTLIVSAGNHDGVHWLPGCLPSVISVQLDWACPRNQFRAETTTDGRTVFFASGFPRSIPGVPPAENLKGLSFAVANMTGLLATVIEPKPDASVDEVIGMLNERTASARWQ